MIYGKPITSPRVDAVQPDSAAAAAGFQPGDVVRDDRRARRSRASPTCSRSSAPAPGETLTFEVDRGGARVDAQGDAGAQGDQGRFRQRAPHGRARDQPVDRPPDDARPAGRAAEAVGSACNETWFVVERTLSYHRRGRSRAARSADQLGGPIRIAQVSGQVATVGLPPLFSLAAVLSVSIGLLNLFPVPLLDGGHLMFYAIEAVRGGRCRSGRRRSGSGSGSRSS